MRFWFPECEAHFLPASRLDLVPHRVERIDQSRLHVEVETTDLHFHPQVRRLREQAPLEPGEPPVIPMAAIGDVSTGVHALAAIACALLHRERTGEGQYIDVSLLDTYIHTHDFSLQTYSASGGKAVPRTFSAAGWWSSLSGRIGQGPSTSVPSSSMNAVVA